ncbi:P-loop NTPase fold protein [Inquilinus sp. NPDC058860]|uniref:KAP family P-loop NTPase fold protein n=1 Tax=Inquilinus sp. NPDC058860 TaxID=3346652 RepID=UPI0036A903FD
MWTDSESDVDYLNYSEVSEMISEMISDDSMLPISIGVYGAWGVGKSSILQFVGKELAADKRNLVIPFDAWLYQDFDDAKSALMMVIAKSLYDATSDDLKVRAASLYRRINKLKFLGLAADIGALAAGLPTFGIFSKAAGAVEDLWDGTADEEDIKAVKDATKEVKERGAMLLKPKEKRNPPEEIAAFRKEFGGLLSLMGRRLVVFVDNLDRCLPGNAIATLEAMRLFLFLPRTAFVVAADEEMIRLAVAKHFSSPGDRHITDYLDKLIQVPVRVPKLGLQEVRAYLFLLAALRGGVDPGKLEELRKFLIDKLRKSWSDEPPFDVEQVATKLGLTLGHDLLRTFETMNRLAGQLAHSLRVNGNPRIVKRLLNVIRMRASVARRRGMAIDEALIAKLALFERCTSEEAIREFYSMVNMAPNGKVGLLRELESVSDNGLPHRLPEAWQKHDEFISDWLKLDPPLGGVDLRPAVYLSRDTLPIRVSTVQISAKTKKAIDVLLRTATVSSKASKKALEELDPAEAGDAMDEMVAVMSRSSDWSKIRNDFRGALMLANQYPAAHKKLVRFVAGLPKVPRWMASLMKGDREASGKGLG